MKPDPKTLVPRSVAARVASGRPLGRRLALAIACALGCIEGSLPGAAAELARESAARPPAEAGNRSGPSAQEKPVPGKRYTAVAWLLVTRGTPCPASPADKEGAAEFESYKSTQEQLLKSPWVLTAALRDETVRRMPIVRRQDEKHNAVPWLASELRVGSVRPASGILTVSLTASLPGEAAALVNAVVRAYFSEVVGAEQLEVMNRLKKLEQLYAEKERELAEMRSRLREMSERLGSSTAPGARLRQQLAETRLLASEKELAGLKGDLRRARGELKLQKILKADTKREEARVQVLEEMTQECQLEAVKCLREAAQIDRTSVELEMATAEIGNLQEVLRTIAAERHELGARLRAPRRVLVVGDPQQPAQVPETPD
jgi:hypothetical protein